ncbi:hypothetical protein CBM2587_B50025 [Cupriavidus taiwanensis]|uniref:Uncharacterized protein n=1 Tax=Cupriavidus taiwanensis TaxID=164546 RepID=A0A375C4U4_9BURK|nr:hypothetical protein CBM2587_B50025 [Cupriavidus taiwanensis]
MRGWGGGGCYRAYFGWSLVSGGCWLRSHALSLESPLSLIFRVFAPLSRSRERGGGEGRRIHEVRTRHTPRRLAAPTPRLCLSARMHYNQ